MSYSRGNRGFPKSRPIMSLRSRPTWRAHEALNGEAKSIRTEPRGHCAYSDVYIYVYNRIRSSKKKGKDSLLRYRVFGCGVVSFVKRLAAV